jgi:double-strand break repair protein MRE11
VPENGFGDEVDLIVWGHEHDCRIDPEPVTGKNYYISQPGSSVATSLAAGEAVPKHVGLLKIQGRKFDMKKLRLRTVRPFVMDDIVLSDVAEIEGVSLENKVQVNKYLKTRVRKRLSP